MKKIFYLLLFFCCLLFVTACGESSKESPVEDFLYEMNNGEVIITGYKGTDLEIYIPSKINDRPVTAIGKGAFIEYDMTHVTIPDSVIRIESDAFCRCECLTSIVFSRNLEAISESAFYGCSSLTEISFENSLQIIEKLAFNKCTSLEKVSLPDSLQFIGRDSFESCDNLISLRIPDNTELEMSVTKIKLGDAAHNEVFVSPIGGSSAITFYNDSNFNEEFKELPTKIIVKEGSFAHMQVKAYLRCGLTVEVE